MGGPRERWRKQGAETAVCASQQSNWSTTTRHTKSEGRKTRSGMSDDWGGRVTNAEPSFNQMILETGGMRNFQRQAHSGLPKNDHYLEETRSVLIFEMRWMPSMIYFLGVSSGGLNPKWWISNMRESMNKRSRSLKLTEVKPTPPDLESTFGSPECHNQGCRVFDGSYRQNSPSHLKNRQIFAKFLFTSILMDIVNCGKAIFKKYSNWLNSWFVKIFHVHFYLLISPDIDLLPFKRIQNVMCDNSNST